MHPQSNQNANEPTSGYENGRSRKSIIYSEIRARRGRHFHNDKRFIRR